MIAMRVADEDVADRPAGDRRDKRVEMLVVLRPGIDDRQFMLADEIAVRAVKGERAGIFGGQRGQRPERPATGWP